MPRRVLTDRSDPGSRGAATAANASRGIRASLDALRRIVRALRLADASIHATTGLSGAQLFVLRNVALGPCESLTALSDRTMTDRTSVAEIVRRLEGRGLVRRAPSPIDRRRRVIEITPTGSLILKRSASSPADLVLAGMIKLSPAALSRLTSSLGDLVTSMGLDSERPFPLFHEHSLKSNNAVRRKRRVHSRRKVR